MPFAALRPCPGRPGQPCSKLTRGGGRCPECAQQREQQRRPEWITKFYSSSAWQHLRTLKRQVNPLCQDCEEADRITPAESVDHIVPIEQQPDLALVMENLRSLCWPCHNTKTRRTGRGG